MRYVSEVPAGLGTFGLFNGAAAYHPAHATLRYGVDGVDCSMSRSDNVWDNAAMESFFSSLKTERIGHKVYRSRDAARVDVFDYIESFYKTV